MGKAALWDLLRDLQSPKYKWVDLTMELSPETPHWSGFQPLEIKKLFDLPTAPMKVFEYTIPGQYGTHVDVPVHFDPKGRCMHEIDVKEFAYALCVVDKSEACKTNADYAVSIQNILDWEEKYGRIPENAFVAFRSDWSKRAPEVFENKDETGQPHYPGWSLDCIKWLFAERNIGAVGHETADTDPAILGLRTGFAAESHVMFQDKLNVELMTNLDLVPPVGAIIFVTFPKVKDGTGFPARCFAICENA